MEALFLKIFNMSVAAGWMVLAVVFLRIVLKKAPRSLFCLLWGLVAIRLVCPFSFESVLSLVPSAEILAEKELYAAALSDKKRAGDTITLAVPYAMGDTRLVTVPVDALEAYIRRGLAD